MIVIGAISGTSVDGIDVAAARFAGAGTPTLQMTPLIHRTVPWSDGVRAGLLSLLPPSAGTVADLCRLDVAAGAEIATAIDALRADLPEGRADLAVSHGQTVYHWVEDGVARGTLQIGQPAPIVEMTGLPVVSDLRSQDIAAGGQGAPLACVLDALVLRGGSGSSEAAAALNLGGIANVTVVGPQGVLAFDTGPANCLIDATIHRITAGHVSIDRDGERAQRGRIDRDLLERLLADPFYAAPAPKSTGREHFHTAYVQQAVGERRGIEDNDLVATLTELTAVTVADALRPYAVTRVLGSGGGMHNPVLVQRLRHHLRPARLAPSDEAGLPTDGKEAYLMALLGYLTWHGIPAVPTGPDGRPVTGAREARVLGRLSPGRHGIRLPEPVSAPTRMIVSGP